MIFWENLQLNRTCFHLIDIALETSTISDSSAVETNNNNIVAGEDCIEAQHLIMNSGRVPAGPGPADPLLAKQKHHHRRAFEYISKALKIDEENGEGESSLFV